MNNNINETLESLALANRATIFCFDKSEAMRFLAMTNKI